jgi:hypothetical protein
MRPWLSFAQTVLLNYRSENAKANRKGSQLAAEPREASS